MPDHFTAPNAACALLGCSIPIVLAGMGGVARSELVSAVSAVGAFGFLGMVREPVALIEQEVARVRAAGHTAFGVNIIPACTEPGLLDRQLDAIIALGVPAVELFWDIDAGVVRRLRDAGIVVAYQVGAPDEAVAAARAGAQLIVAQGVEAGGHVRDTVPLRQLLPAVLQQVDLPVLAAGGLATGADLVTAMALGAQGVVLGTALMATSESFAHPYHRQRLVAAGAADTELTEAYHINWPPNAPVRVLRNPALAAMAPDERKVIGEEEGRPIYLFSTDSPLRSMTGDFASMALYAGTGVGAIDSVVPAAERIATILDQARALRPATAPLAVEASSGVCFAGEFSGAYMGHAEPAEITAALDDIGAHMGGLLRLALALPATDAAASAPSFRAEAAALSGWILALREQAGSVPAPLPADTAMAGRAQLIGHIRRRIAALVPRMPENATRATLEALARYLAAI